MASGSWLLWILASSVGLSMYDLCKKASIKGNAVFPTLFATTSGGWGALTVYLLFAGRLSEAVSVSAVDVFLLLAKSLIVGSSWTATYMALRTLPITSAAPIRATGPFWTVLGAMAIFGEIPKLVQGVGMALVLAGCVFFSVSSHRDKSSGGIKAVAFAFAGTLLGSCSALYDKHLLQGIGLAPLAVLWWFLGGMTFLYAVAASFNRGGFKWRWTMPLTGILLVLTDACYFTAVALPGAQISVLSLVRRSSIVITFFVGGALFRERDIKRKAFALVAVLAGVVLLCL